MDETDAVRGFLRDRGCPDDVVTGGVPGLVADWERAVEQVVAGYPLGLDDYLNDLDGRQLLEEALAFAPSGERDGVCGRLRTVDDRMKARVSVADECLWGDAVAEAEGWTAERNWWYFSLPRAPGPLLKEDLDHIGYKKPENKCRVGIKPR